MTARHGRKKTGTGGCSSQRAGARGEVLLRDARTALEAVTAAARRARQAGSPSPRLRVALKLTEPVLAALAAADPLAARTRLCLADLADRNLPG